MDQPFDLAQDFSQFWNADESSIFVDEVRQRQRDDSVLQQRVTALSEEKDEAWDADVQATVIRQNIKWAKMAPMEDDDARPSGRLISDEKPKKMSLKQSPIKKLLGAVRHESDLDEQSKCDVCATLGDAYGKTTFGRILRSATFCSYCQLIIDVFNIYSKTLDEGAKVRILAPIVSGDTLHLWYQGKEIRFMLDLFVLPRSLSPVPSITAATEISGDTSSPRAFAQARSWLDKCTKSHERCPKNTNVPLPTRLIEIKFGKQGYNTRLVETGKAHGRYCCLSHRWGDPETSTIVPTTRVNYSEQLKHIPLASLSSTFQDAVRTAYRLGQQYLWIDSLCIIQGDEADWELEAARMGSYYMNAYVTIAASWSPGSNHGFLTWAEPEYIGRQVPFRRKRGQVYVIHSRRTLTHGWRWPLLSRGWVYQERLLSPRVLHFGNAEMVWECLTGTTCECGLSDNLHSNLSNKVEHFNIMEQTSSAETFSDIWRDMVAEYTGLYLTFASDLFPAIAGIAKEMQLRRRSNYYAGLWEDSFIGDMLWMRSSGPFECLPPRPSDSKAPTWSWASVGHARIDYSRLGTRRNSARKEMCYGAVRETYAKILSVSSEPLAETNYGGGEWGYLIFRGPAITASLLHVPLHTPPNPKDFHNYPKLLKDFQERYEREKHELKTDLILPGDEEKALRHYDFYPDYGLFHEGPFFVGTGSEVLVAKVALVEPEGPLWRRGRSIWGIVLRRVGGMPKTYQRIGLMCFNILNDGDVAERFGSARDMVIRIV